ncbi:hypothetical protein MBLNU230_g1354t1 [Neophaeotheca triangularis]
MHYARGSTLARHQVPYALLPSYGSFHRTIHVPIDPDRIVSQLPITDSEDGLWTLRRRKHGQKPLPLPPILDPKAIARKSKGKEPKQNLAEDEVSEFQKELGSNAFAQALATPVRQCSITGARLPTHFLLPFRTVYTRPSDTGTTPGRKQLQAKLLPMTTASESADNKGPASRSTAYVLNSKSLLQHLNTKHRWGGILSQRMKERHSVLTGGGEKKMTKVKTEWQWDPATPELVLKGLREDVLDKLRALVAADAFEEALVRPVKNSDTDVAVWLETTRATEAAGGDVEQRGVSVCETGPPTYNLRDLLGDQYTHDWEFYAFGGEKPPYNRIGFRQHSRVAAGLLAAFHRLDAYLRHAPEP